MKDLSCLIVDDEPLAIDIIAGFLERLQIGHITRCGNGIEAFQQLQERKFDILFLDIEMPLLTGIDLLRSLPHKPAVVITTAYRDYAVEGFELEVSDYLVKPFSFARFIQTMEKLTRTPPPETSPGSIFLKTDRKLIRVPVAEILYIKSIKDYIRVISISGEYLCHQPLSEITAALPSEKFFRIHRSYTVALNKIEQVGTDGVSIRGKILPLSRRQRQELQQRLKALS